MKRFTITDFDWKDFPMHPEKFDGYQLSLKCKVVFEEPIERNEECGYGDDKFCFTLMASLIKTLLLIKIRSKTISMKN